MWKFISLTNSLKRIALAILFTFLSGYVIILGLRFKMIDIKVREVKMRKLIGDKAFYKMVCTMALPLIFQNFITNFVNFLDNIMVGQVGTEQMSGVAIIGNMIFVFNLALFGGYAGAGIFAAQYYGKGDHKSVGDTMRYKLYLGVLLTAAALILFTLFDEPLIRLFLSNSSDDVGDVEATLMYARQYLKVMLVGLLPYAVSQVYATTLRETGDTVLPMTAGIAAVLTNLVFNYILIFGHFGAKAMGVEGAAIATVISRFAELGILVVATHARAEKHGFIRGFYKRLAIPRELVRKIMIKGTPLLFNEVMWSLAITALNQSYSTRGLTVVAAINISSTVTNLFNIVFMAIGSAISIIVGPLLGAGKIDEAKDTDRKMIALCVASCFVMGVLFVFAAPYIPLIYKTEESVRSLATYFMIVSATAMPLHAFNHACYFTLRTGGRTVVTTLFDSVCSWVVFIPLAYVLTRYTQLHIVTVYAIVLYAEIVKAIIGFVMVKNGSWAKNMVGKEANRNG